MSAETAFPRCGCVENLLGQLRAKGNDFVLKYAHNDKGEIVGVPIIETMRFNTKRYARGNYALLPNFCPFCGKQYSSGVIRLGKKKETSRARKG